MTTTDRERGGLRRGGLGDHGKLRVFRRSPLSRFQTARGTRDILPVEAEAWQKVEALARDTFARYGFLEIRTPTFEPTGLFERAVGGSTDIVRKEMFTFLSGEDSLTLRPEMTAPVARAYIQHGLSRMPGAERLYYIGPMFRHERPQKGRQRQFHQIGVEVFGADDPYVDAETIEMALSFLGRVASDLAPECVDSARRPDADSGDRVDSSSVRLVINSVGCSVCRPVFRAALERWLEEPLPDGRRSEKLCADCRRRLVENPLRVFDCKIERDREILAGAPTILEHLCGPCREHFDAVQDHLRRLGLAFTIDARLVRGLDYYVRTAFEVLADRGLGSQNSLMGGGRYDGLVKELGGPDVPGFGWALGLERLMMLVGALSGEESAKPPALRSDLFVAHLGEEGRNRAIVLARDMRAAGLSVRLDPGGKNLAGQIKRAVREGARFVLIVGDDEIRAGAYQLKDLTTQTQEGIEAGDHAKLLAKIGKGTGRS